MPFTVVQAVPTVRAAGTTATVTLPQATGSQGPSTLVACITGDDSVTNPVITGITLGGSPDNWKAAATGPGNVAFAAAIWYDPGCAAGQTAVVVSSTASGAAAELYVAVYEVTGVLAADKHSTGDGTGGVTAWSSGTTGTTAQASEIFFGACTASSAVPTVTGAGTWTTQTSAAGTFDQVAGFQAVTMLGTAAFSGTIPAGAYSAIIATFALGVAKGASSAAVTAKDTSSAAVTGTTTSSPSVS